MKFIKLAGSCMNQTPLDFSGNLRNILYAIEEAKLREVAVLCLPELAICGYGCEDAFFSEYVVQRSLESLAEIVEASEGITLCVGLPLCFENSMYNVVAMVHDGELLGLVAKQELAGDGIYYEPRWFKRWETGAVAYYQWKDELYPFGDLIFEIDGVRFGFEICEDAWNGERPAQRHYMSNVEIILNPSASNFAFGKSKVRERLVTETSRAFMCTYVYSNLLGNESGRIIFDGEILISQGGELLARNKRFSFKDYQLLTVVVDAHALRNKKKKSFNFEPEVPLNLLDVKGELKDAVKEPLQAIPPYETKEEEFFYAESLGLFDYMRKSRSKGFTLSLSGGADSSACAVLCAKMIEKAEKELGRENLLQKLAYARLNPEENLVFQLLACVYQATENSGNETLTSAKALATGLGAAFFEWNVTPLHDYYKQLTEQAIGRELSWQTDDIALQNIQARLRSPGIWMLTNIRNSLLLTTSNRSEAAVGYATMDGDTSGGLAPLAGIDKAFLRNWLVWAETMLDVPSLSYVNNLQPTAELRPSEFHQTDEDDLMPYPILDAIEKCAIRDYQSPVEVFHTLRGICPDANLKKYIRKFFNLWCRNQWKRERYAPSFHLDDENLDPRSWCRYPILNGGYNEALAEVDRII
ncbi:MAG: NAD(+) synthase [Bacteroidia bacterium]